MKDTGILVVDNEEATRVDLEKVLSWEGYRVKTVAGGGEAILALQKDIFDLVILEIYMPRIDGFKVLRFIQNNKKGLPYPKIKAMVLTSFYDLKNALKSKRLGAEAIMPKSYDLVDLLTTIERVLERSEIVTH